MHLDVFREPTLNRTTLGQLLLDGTFECYCLEDELRVDPDPNTPINEAKVKGQTAVPAGTYELGYRDSPKFGPDTLWVKDVPGFDYILIHSGVDIDSTEGCLVVGDTINRDTMKISGGKVRKVLEKLKNKVLPRLKAGEKATITYHDPDY